MTLTTHPLRREIERTKRLTSGLNDERSVKAATRYVEELSADLDRSSHLELSLSMRI